MLSRWAVGSPPLPWSSIIMINEARANERTTNVGREMGPLASIRSVCASVSRSSIVKYTVMAAWHIEGRSACLEFRDSALANSF